MNRTRFLKMLAGGGVAIAAPVIAVAAIPEKEKLPMTIYQHCVFYETNPTKTVKWTMDDKRTQGSILSYK